MRTEPGTRSWQTAGVWCLLVLAACLYWPLAARTSFDFDEMRTAESVRLPIPKLLVERARAGHPPLFFLLERGVASVLGPGEGALRLVPLVCGLAGAWVAGCWLAAAGMPRWRLPVTLLMLLSPLRLFWSVNARAIVLLELCALVTGWIWQREASRSAGEPSKATSRWSVTGLTFVGLASHASYGWVVASVLVGAWRRGPGRAIAGAAVLGAAAVAPVYVWMYAVAADASDPLNWAAGLGLERLAAMPIRPFVLGTELWPRWLLGLLAVASLVAAAVGAWRLGRARFPITATWMVPLAGAMLLLALGVSRMALVPRYFLPSFAAQAILTVAALGAQPAGARRPRAAALALVLLLLVVAGSSSVLLWRDDPRPDWRGATEWIAALPDPDGPVVVFCGFDQGGLVAHYLRRAGLAASSLECVRSHSLAPAGWLRSREESPAVAREAFWWATPRQRAVQGEVATSPTPPGYRLERRRSFSRLELERFVPIGELPVAERSTSPTQGGDDRVDSPDER